jgi:hypothetical protein
MRQEFTLEQALDIQEEHINEWELVLNTEAFVRLTIKVKEANKKGYKSPYDVVRGSTLSQYVADIIDALVYTNVTREMPTEANTKWYSSRLKK